MAWTTTLHGSWASASTDTPAEVDDALALPGSWRWHPRGVVLVRRDQVPNLAPPVPLPPPVAQSMVPNSGPLAGGTRSVIVLQSPGAADATGVTYDGVPGTALTVNNPLQPQITSPAGASDGPVSVVVQTPRGESNPVQFNYNP